MNGLTRQANADARYAACLADVLAWSRTQEWRGWNKHDGLNSPILRAVLGWAKWPRIAAVQLVTRAPVNLRPALLIPKTYNPKGLGLFLQTWVAEYQRTGDPDCLAAIDEIGTLLLRLRARGPEHGQAWGYHYPWQDPGFFSPAGTPNAVVTAFACEALLDAYAETGEERWLAVVGDAIEFLIHDLPVLKDTAEELCLGYQPVPMKMRVLDVSILIGALLSRYDHAIGSAAHAATARRLVNYVVQRQTAEGAWFYTDPPGDSLIRHDNYHTGFILDALHRYMTFSGDAGWQDRYAAGLEFYATHHFRADGAPRWMSDQDYPFDIHGAAQGIITFSRHREAYAGLAERVADWALDNMYDGAGRFYYQKTRYLTKRFTLLRWCNGWMCRALSVLLLARHDAAGAAGAAARSGAAADA